ncbi:EthD domain-containing protein [Streptomyces sp. NPDC005708]|uniref:EthD domain-containing protein n=1 Tax=Streptomyces sp. NPDC005708 TaxID=3154564 RepID=UPI0034104227
MTVRLVFCLKRLETLTQEEFLAYWHDVHAPLVRERSAALRIARYEQAHPVPGDPAGLIARLRAAPEPYDGVASLWFGSLEDFQAGGSTPEGRQAAKELLEDERRFIDLANSPIWLATDRGIF